MGLFDKKFCSICGEKIGLLGNRKLEDGNLCKECAGKLSPWFSERKQSTVDDIRQQLEYREANKDAVSSFNVTRSLGYGTKVLLDEDNCKFMVTSASNFGNANPDVLDFSDVTGCNLEINEDKDEVKYKDAEGKEVSYNPPVYDYSYDFYMTINVNNPYFNQIRFKLNPSSVTVESEKLQTARGTGFGPQRPMGGMQQPQRAYGQQTPPANRVGPAMGSSQRAYGQQTPPPGRVGPAMSTPQRGGMQSSVNRAGGFGAAGMGAGMSSRKVDPTTNAKYREYSEMGEEIKAVLLQIRQDTRDAITAGNAPKTAVVCPYCGATTVPDEQGRCEYCGGAVY